jgi:hypothetical protein
MQRSLVLMLAGLSGCALHHAELRSSGQVLTVTRAADGACGPIGIRRSSLGARWGEYVRVWVSSPGLVSGEARLHVDGRAAPLQRFDTAPRVDPSVQVAVASEGVSVELPALVPSNRPQHQVVLDAAWTNERLDVPSAIEAGHVIDITVSDLHAGSGTCSDVVFTLEQGVFQPNVDERAWVAELTRRGGPELQAWLVAEAQRKEQIRLEHYALAEQRRVEWQVQLEARREQARVEAAAVVEAARHEEAARVTAVQAEAVRRQSIRQAHYAEYERRKEAQRMNVEAAQQVALATPELEEVRGDVGQVSVASRSSVNAGATAASASSGEGSVTAVSARAAGSASQQTTETRTTVSSGSSSAVSYDVNASARQAPGLQGQVVSSESVVATEAQSFPGWSTPTQFSRVTVSSEQVAPAPPPPQPQPRAVQARVEADVAVGVLHVLGALFQIAANAPPPVHRAGPATPASCDVNRAPLPPPPPAR